MRLTTAQLELVRLLWERGEATVGEVHAALNATRPVALTTVATLLARLEKRGVVTHRAEGRQYVYRAVVAPDEVRTSALSGWVEHLFGGNVTAAVSHLLDEGDFDADDLARLRALLDAKLNDQNPTSR